MKIFRPVEKMSAAELLITLEDMVGVAFGIGFFIGISMLVVVIVPPQGMIEVMLVGLGFAAILGLFLALHIHMRRNILPALKRRIPII